MAAPVININTSGAFGLTNLTDANATTGFSGFNDGSGGTPSPSLATDIFIQSTGSVGTKISGTNQNKGLWWDNASGIDFTVAGRHLYIWILVTTVSLMNDINAGGLYVKCADDASGANWSKWWVSGADVYPGGWVRITIDLSKRPSEEAVTGANIASLRWFGAGIKSTGTSVADNFYIDRIDYGDGLQIEAGDAGDPANWEALFQADDNVSNKYGVITKKEGVYFVKGGITIGDPAGTVTTLWEDTSAAQVVFENPVYHNGASLVSMVDSPNLYKLEIVGNGTGTTDVTFGEVVGTGDDRQGINGGSISNAPRDPNSAGTGELENIAPQWELDADTDIADVDSVEFFGVAFRGISVAGLDVLSKTKVIGCSFLECGDLNANLSEILNCSIIDPKDRGGLILDSASNNAKQLVLVAGGDAGGKNLNFAWEVDVSLAPVILTDNAEVLSVQTGTASIDYSISGNYFTMGYVERYAKLNIDTSTARSGGTLVWEYSTTSGWSTLTVVDGTNTLSTTGAQDVTFEPPSDWAAVSLFGEVPCYHVRLRASATTSTDPVLDEIIVSDIVEYPVRITVAGTFSFENYFFAGTPSADVNNAVSATIEDFYDGSADGPFDLDDSDDGVGQSFTGVGGTLSACQFDMDRFGSPTGNMVAKVYAHTGSFGSTGTPTGAALATSNPIDVSTLSTTAARITFEFEDEFVLVNTTNYFVVVEYTGGDASNFVGVYRDTTSPTDAGNTATLAGSTWTDDSTIDCNYWVHSGAIVVINNTEGANTSSAVQTGTNPGATIIKNPVTVKVTVRDANTLAVIENQRLLLEAAAGGNLPSNVTVTISRVGTVATVAHTAHGMVAGQRVAIRGANEPEYNKIATISNIQTNSYDYTVTGSPATPATGTIKATAVILNGLSDSGGVVQDTAFEFTGDQPVEGHTRKGTAAPFYKTAPIVGTITSAGLDTTAFAVPD